MRQAEERYSICFQTKPNWVTVNWLWDSKRVSKNPAPSEALMSCQLPTTLCQRQQRCHWPLFNSVRHLKKMAKSIACIGNRRKVEKLHWKQNYLTQGGEERRASGYPEAKEILRFFGYVFGAFGSCQRDFLGFSEHHPTDLLTPPRFFLLRLLSPGPATAPTRLRTRTTSPRSTQPWCDRCSSPPTCSAGGAWRRSSRVWGGGRWVSQQMGGEKGSKKGLGDWIWMSSKRSCWFLWKLNPLWKNIQSRLVIIILKFWF